MDMESDCKVIMQSFGCAEAHCPQPPCCSRVNCNCLIIGLNNHYPFSALHVNSKQQKHITEHHHTVLASFCSYIHLIPSIGLLGRAGG